MGRYFTHCSTQGWVELLLFIIVDLFIVIMPIFVFALPARIVDIYDEICPIYYFRNNIWASDYTKIDMFHAVIKRPMQSIIQCALRLRLEKKTIWQNIQKVLIQARLVVPFIVFHCFMIAVNSITALIAVGEIVSDQVRMLGKCALVSFWVIFPKWGRPATRRWGQLCKENAHLSTFTIIIPTLSDWTVNTELTIISARNYDKNLSFSRNCSLFSNRSTFTVLWGGRFGPCRSHRPHCTATSVRRRGGIRIIIL